MKHNLVLVLLLAAGCDQASRGGAANGGTAPCGPRSACDAPPPPLGPARPFKHGGSELAAATEPPAHRGRDLFLPAGAPQWVLGKFAYGRGPVEKALEGQEIDVYLLRGCGSNWEKLGTFRTSDASEPSTVHATEEGVVDTGGRIYVPLSTAPLAVGRHRVHMVVAGDFSSADQYIEVLPTGAKIVVSDVDGTLTTSENVAVFDIVGIPPEANPGAAAALGALAGRGYYIFYLTGRPEWFVQKTREWLERRAFPRGILHTTLTLTGATHDAAVTYKSDELKALKSATGISPTYAFGNRASDVRAYGAAAISPPSNAYYFGLGGELQGGTYFDDYGKLVPLFNTLAPACSH